MTRDGRVVEKPTGLLPLEETRMSRDGRVVEKPTGLLPLERSG